MNAGVEDEDHFFSTQERQSIVLHLLYAIRILENETINGIKFKIDQSLSNCTEFFSYEMNELFIYLVQRGLEKELIRQVIPLHNKEQLNHLKEIWVWPKNVFKPQPIGRQKKNFFIIESHRF